MSDDTERAPQAAPYVLGHTDHELQRLRTQAALIDPITKRFLTDAGILPGMRVLDIGTGAGHVAFLAAEIVGDTGEVVGVDRSAEAVSAATAEAAARRLGNVSFRAGDPIQLVFGRPFDAVIGRYVLQFQADPAAMLRKVAAHAKPGGVVVFHELDWGGISSYPPATTYDSCCRWCIQAISDSGAETGMGLRLRSAFVAAGLPEPSLRMEALLGGGSQAHALIQQLVGLVRTLSPAIERLGLATAEETSQDKLFDRIAGEVHANGSVLVGRLQVGCWSRTV
jgi:SAM-dependent methyltransferase